MSTQEAIDYALSVATAGAGASCLVKFTNPLPMSDVHAQVLTMKVMSDNIASMYGFTSVPGLTGFTIKLLGIGGGVKLASEVAMPIPFIGLGASTFAAFLVHMTVGVVLIIIFEAQQKGSIPLNYMEKATTREIAYLLRIAVDAMEEGARNKDQVGAIQTAIARFEASGIPEAYATPSEDVEQVEATPVTNES